MAEEITPAAAAAASTPAGPARGKDEIALDLTKFIAVTTGYGKGGSGAGYGAPKSTRTPEEYADAILELFEKCRAVVNKQS
jgi:hypothetical protein